MVNRRSWVMVGVLVACGMLSACSSDGQYAFDRTAEDMAGSWTATGDLKTVLHLAPDGSFSADSWPLNVACAGADAEYVAEISGAATADLAGEWNFYGGSKGSSLPDVTLSVLDDACPDGEPRGYVWEGEDRTISLCFPLGTADPDSFQSNRMLVLRLNSSEVSRDATPCV